MDDDYKTTLDSMTDQPIEQNVESDEEKALALKQAAQVLLDQYIRELNIYCLQPEIETKEKPSYHYKKGLVIRDNGAIIRISDMEGFFSGHKSYQHFIPIIESVVQTLKERGITQIAIRGNLQLQHILVKFCLQEKYQITVVNFRDEDLPYPIQQSGI